jgi:energy-coupling factor transporter ATP-binding protein EcfA2
MKILELEINKVRGLPHLLVKPNGDNFVVWGPNGSGKSAIVDAIDFLLTGRISRLTGKGTKGITLKRHGPHINHKPEDVLVRAIVKLPNIDEPIEIKRNMEHPNELICNDDVIPHFKPIQNMALRGQHILTRRYILRYITAEAGDRAQQIQELLNIIIIENIRKAFGKVQHKLRIEVDMAKQAVEKSKGSVNATLQLDHYDENKVLQTINKNRKILHGKPISVVKLKKLKLGLKPPTKAYAGDINITLLSKDIQNILKVIKKPYQLKILKKDEFIRGLIKDIRSDRELLHSFHCKELIELGISLIDEDGSCPLCDKSWPQGELSEYLEQKLLKADKANEFQKRIEEGSAFIIAIINNTVAGIQKVIEGGKTAGLKEELNSLQSWQSNLKELLSALNDPIKKYPDARFNEDDVKRMLAPDEIDKYLKNIHSGIEKYAPLPTPEQNAWDTLTRLEENLKALEQARKELDLKESSHKRGVLLSESFQKARDSVLGKLYDDIRDKFVDLYRQLHGTDENNFVANLEPDGAALKFEVDFYGRGTHPPHALHSEGHQDSMGLCLYLALAEELTRGLIDLIVLDDVVMSVDSDHRRSLCSLLATSFPNRQFFITTHDKTWANQLRSEGIVKSQGSLELFNWNIDTGPQINYQVDLWERIEEDLSKNDVPGAAGRMRRGLEQFFGLVCDSLHVPTVHKLIGNWEFGELLLPATDHYETLLKKAKNSAKSWNNEELQLKFSELDSIRSGNFTVKDFRPVTEAFQDLCGLFTCSNCEGMLKIVTANNKPTGVQCNCGEINWNLILKS